MRYLKDRLNKELKNKIEVIKDGICNEILKSYPNSEIKIQVKSYKVPSVKELVFKVKVITNNKLVVYEQGLK